MDKNGPIIVLDDDDDDNYIARCVLEEVSPARDVLCFKDPEDAYQLLASGKVNPFLILCDMYFPKITGIEFRHRICAIPNADLADVPFIFLSGAPPTNKKMLIPEGFHAGYFRKRVSYEEQCALIKMIISYWEAIDADLSKSQPRKAQTAL